jgi:hypothetical protein
MPRVTTYTDSRPYIAQLDTLVFDMGRDIDWANNNSLTTIPAGTTMVILAGGMMCPYAYKPGAETAAGILLAGADMNDRSGTPGHALIIGGSVYENLLISYEDADWADQKTDLDAAGRWNWFTYEDDRAV